MKYLFLDDNQIADLSPLTDLTQIERLELDNNRVADISPLMKLPKLTSSRVSIDGNPGLPAEQLELLKNVLRYNGY